MQSQIKRAIALTVVIAGTPFVLPMLIAPFVPGSMLMGWTYWIVMTQAGQIYRDNVEGGDTVK